MEWIVGNDWETKPYVGPTEQLEEKICPIKYVLVLLVS